MKTIRAALSAFILLAAMTFPGLAQDDSVMLTYELTVEGDPPEGVTFFGLYGLPFSDAAYEVALTDADGDGVYTATVESPVNGEGETAYAIVYSETDSGYDEGRVGVLPETLEEGFAVAALEDGATIEASVSFGDAGGDTVTKTFTLELTGDVPEGTAFSATYGRGVEDIVVFCGEIETRGAGAACEGGRTYTAEVEFARGSTIDVAFRRERAGSGEIFHRTTETLTADAVNAAYYRFGGTGDAAPDMPEEMPDTGAGALAAAGAPWGAIAVGVSLVLAGRRAALRRR